MDKLFAARSAQLKRIPVTFERSCMPEEVPEFLWAETTDSATDALNPGIPGGLSMSESVGTDRF
jgi:hypothetical protein